MYELLLQKLADGATVVTANNRLARTLRHCYDQQQLAAGAKAWASPDIVSWTQWLLRLWDESRLLGGAGAQGQLLEDSAANLLWQDAIGQADRSRVGMPVQTLARAARKSWAQLHEWQAVDALEWTDAGLSPDQQAFLSWSGAFRAMCEAKGQISSEQLVTLLTLDATNGLFSALGTLVFTGFDEWVPARQALRDALEQQGADISIISAAETAGRVEAALCPSADDELHAAALWARARLEQQPEASVGIIVADLATRAEQTRRVFADVFEPGWRISGWPADLPLNISYGRPLAAMPAIHTALLLFQLASGRAIFDDLSLLLRSTHLGGAHAEAPQRGQLEVSLRDTVRVEFRLQECLPGAQKIAPLFAGILSELIESRVQIRSMGRCTAADWAHWLTNLLRSTGWPGDNTLDSETWQVLQAWNKLLAAFAATGAQRGAIKHGEAVSILRQLAQEQLFQEEGSAQGAQVMGVLEAAGHQFDHVWICGMARELWPAAARPDPFIPLTLQRRLTMPDCHAGQTLHYTESLTRRMLASAPEIVVSWPGQLDGEELSLSPLINAHATYAVSSKQTSELWNQQLLGSGSLESLTADKPPAISTTNRTRGGTSVLNLQAVSPLNAFIEKRLGAIELRRPTVGIDPLRRGNITHKALEVFYRPIKDRNALAKISAEDRRTLLTTALEAALRKLPGLYDKFMQELAARELDHQLARINEFIELDLQRPDFVVGPLEEPHEVTVGPLTLRIQLDRLDTLATGGKFVIDYKTGLINRQDWNPAKPRDLQLPLYVSTLAHDADAVAFAQVSVRGIAYDGVGLFGTDIEGIRSPGSRNRIEVKYLYPQTDIVIESWDALREEWFHLLTTLAKQFAEGDFRFDPLNPESARGQFAVLSRVYDQDTAGQNSEAEE